MSNILFLVGVPDAHVERTLKRAKELNIRVIVVDNKEKLKAFEAKMSNAYKTAIVNYKNYEELYEIFNKFHSEEEIKMILSFKEEALLNTAKIAKLFNLKSVPPEVVEISISKYQTRLLLEENGILSPKFCLCKTYEELAVFWEKVKAPIILKPDNLQGSVGIYKVTNKEELYQNFLDCLKVSNAEYILAEEFIEGKEVSIEAMVFKNRVEVFGVTEKLLYPGTFIESGHITPYEMEKYNESDIKNLVTQICQAMKINIGPLHIEVFITENGLVVGEIHTRYGGDNITTITELSLNTDITSPLMADLANLDYSYQKKRVTNYVAIRFFDIEMGKIQSVEGIEKIKTNPNVIDYSLNFSIGDNIHTIKSSFDRPGWFIVKGKDKEELFKNIEECMTDLKVVTMA